MANEYGVFNQGAVVLEFWSGVITLDELLAHELEQSQDLTIKDAAIVVADCRDAHFKLDKFDILSISQSTLARDGYHKKKIAIIINADTWDIANDYSEQFWGTGNEVFCFHSIEAASAWLGLDSKNLQKRFATLKKICTHGQTI